MEGDECQVQSACMQACALLWQSAEGADGSQGQVGGVEGTVTQSWLWGGQGGVEGT